MTNGAFIVPPTVSFEQAIALAQSLLEHMEQGTLSEEQVESVISALVATENGARGFFVTYLSTDSSLPDQPIPAVIQALQSSPTVVAPLLVKNLSMSTAMAIVHRRSQREDMAQGSDRVHRRSLQLIQALQTPELASEAQSLVESIQTHTGTYQAFLERWSYDETQQTAIYEAIAQTGLLKSL